MWNYYRDEQSDPFSTDSKSFKYKATITGNTYDGNDVSKVGKKETEIVIPLKHLSKFGKI